MDVKALWQVFNVTPSAQPDPDKSLMNHKRLGVPAVAFDRIAKMLYWKLCFPESITVVPPLLQIVSGPFRGMRYTSRSNGSYHSCKVLGTYEKELHAVIESIQRQRYDTLVDIGAAEGYYAVGLAVTSAIGRVVAFEAEQRGRSLLAEIATRNSLTIPIDIRGRCEPNDLINVLEHSGRTLIICDVEGYEAVLLEPDLIPRLRDVSIIVELHEFASRGIGELLKERFFPSHAISEIASAPRTWADFPGKSRTSQLLPRKLALRAMNEGRAQLMAWLWMVPTAHRNAEP